MEVLDGRAFQLVAVPVLAPLPIGWVVMGFAVDDALARDLRQLTELEVSFALDAPGGWRVLASTLSGDEQQALLAAMPARSNAVTRLVMNIASVDHQALVIPLDDNDNARIVAVLHRSLDGALAAFERLRFTLIVLAGFSLVLSIVGSVAVARNITRPLETLASAAARIEHGDYVEPVNVQRADEIGVLASSLNHMRGGIADREKRILKLAYEDPLTDLANRSRFNNELEQAIALCHAERHQAHDPHDGSRSLQIRQRHARPRRRRSRAARSERAPAATPSSARNASRASAATSSRSW